jgi:hypothetical protein
MSRLAKILIGVVGAAVVLAVGLFVGWIVLVNVIWYFINPDFLFLRKTSF